MPLKARCIIAVLSFLLFFFVLNLIRKRRMRIEYSLLWLVISSIILVMSIWSDLGDRLARWVGVDYPPALFFFIAIFFLILILLHFSTEMTRLKDQNKMLVQELSLLKQARRRR
jgi:hypothetical protein